MIFHSFVNVYQRVIAMLTPEGSQDEITLDVTIAACAGVVQWRSALLLQSGTRRTFKCARMSQEWQTAYNP